MASVLVAAVALPTAIAYAELRAAMLEALAEDLQTRGVSDSALPIFELKFAVCWSVRELKRHSAMVRAVPHPQISCECLCLRRIYRNTEKGTKPS